MPRRVEDIVPSGRRTIRDIPLGAEKKGNKKREGDIVVRKMPDVEHKPVKRGKGLRNLLIILGVIVIVVIAGYFVSTYFVRAVFTIAPKVIPINIDASYVANNVTKENLLTYKLVKYESVASTTVASKDTVTVSAKAGGTINIYNAYSAEPRRLIAGTRFKGPNGQVYTLTSSIMMPGYKTQTNGSIIPGMIWSTIVAQESGSQANISWPTNNKTLKIIAYEGGDKYDKIYGELIGSIDGGVSGVKKEVNPEVLQSAIETLKNQLGVSLLAKMKSDLNADSFVFEKGYMESYSEPSIGGNTSNEAVISVRGTIYGFVFNKDDLVSKISKQTIQEMFGSFGYQSLNMDKVSFVLSNRKDYNPEKGGAIIMQLKGNIELQGEIPIDEIKGKIAGLSLTDTTQIMKSYGSIIDLDKTSGQVVPPWAKVPNNLDKISVVIQK